jgi:hypothetical protein
MTSRLLALGLLSALPWLVQPSPSPRLDDELEASMHAAEEALEAIAASLEAHAKAPAEGQAAHLEAARTQADQLQSSLLAAYGQSPRAPKELTEASAQAAFTVRYQRKILSTLDLALGLELALIEGNIEGARGAVGDLFEAEQTGHREFRPKRQRRGGGEGEGQGGGNGSGQSGG